MSVSTLQAMQVGFEAKHWSSGPIGNGTESEILRRASVAVVEFVQDDVPKELKLAASTIWLAVSQAHLGDLYSEIHNDYRPHTLLSRSEDGWRLHFIRDGIGIGGTPQTLGLGFTRPGADPANYKDSPIVSVSTRWGIRREPQTRYTDAYVWVRPKERGQGVASAALKSLEFYRGDEFRVPFDVDLTNPAASKLMERYATRTEAATA